MTAGIIGYGRFGKLLCEYLRNYLVVYSYDIKNQNVMDGVRKCNLKTAASQDIVILSVSIRNLKNVLKKISKILKPNCLVIDVCSVKELPGKWMLEILPENVNILATHPLFGPDSINKGFEGNKLIFCPVRINKIFYRKLKSSISNSGLEIIEMKPDEHDKIMAYTQTLMHSIARSLPRIENKSNLITTKNYSEIIKLFNILKKDSNELFVDMIRYNRYSKDVSNEFLKNFKLLYKSCK